MKTHARDGQSFTSGELATYTSGFNIGKSRKASHEFMGSANGTGFAGRHRLIFNEGLEDGYNSTELLDKNGTEISIGDVVTETKDGFQLVQPTVTP